jgi:hypothetical protein
MPVELHTRTFVVVTSLRYKFKKTNIATYIFVKLPIIKLSVQSCCVQTDVRMDVTYYLLSEVFLMHVKLAFRAIH